MLPQVCLVRVLGSANDDGAPGESTIFQWHSDMYILENLFCGYIDHYGQWNDTFKANHRLPS